MAEDPQPMTLQQRIASLNAAHIGRMPGETPRLTTRPKPEVPMRRPVVVRQHSVNIPHEQVNGTVTEINVGNQPSGPPPLPNRKLPPPLPSRKSSDEQSRRTSVASITSISTTESNALRITKTRTKSGDSQRVKAPAWGEHELPPLPTRGQPSEPKKTYSDGRPKYVNRAPTSSQSLSQITGFSSSPNVQQSSPSPSPSPSLPMRRSSEQKDLPKIVPIRKIPPIPSASALEQAKRAAFSYNSSEKEPVPDHIPERSSRSAERPTTNARPVSNPPPIPLSSRPDLSAVQATKPKYNATSITNGFSQNSTQVTSNVCLVCRDFSGPDHYASLFPRQQVASLQNLAQQLTSPFPSLTDKARAIFTWLHHNIAYDVQSFFNNCVKGSTPQSTLQSGLAVCEGYASLFTNIATHAGLESVVISGHGKGYGYTPLAPGQAVPPFNVGHAWNAVKIDNGEWKLIDSCWGAGYVQGKGLPYVKQFNPAMFNMSNEEFGIKHFPSNKDHFFLPGNARMVWEEYIQINPDSWPYECEAPTVFSNAKVDYSIGERTVLPRDRKVRVNAPGVVRFQFALLCPHWTLEHHTKKGPPPVFMLAVHGVDGRSKDHVPLQHVRGSTPGGGGDFWYIDVTAKELGAPGQTITLFAVTSFGERKDARGLTVREFREGKGRVGMGFTGIAAWDLV